MQTTKPKTKDKPDEALAPSKNEMIPLPKEDYVPTNDEIDIHPNVLFRNKYFKQFLFKIAQEKQGAYHIDTSWQAMIDRILQHRGYSKARIAREVGVSRRTINRWFCGEVDRPHNVGFSRLLRLYCRVCSNDIERFREYQRNVAGYAT